LFRSRPAGQLDRIGIEGVAEAGQPTARSSRLAPHRSDRHRGDRAEHALDEPERSEVGSEEEEDERLEGIVERRDRPVLRPRPPLVAAQQVAQGMRMLEDAQAVREVVVLVRVEEWLVGEQPEREPGGEGGGEDGEGPGREERAGGRPQSSSPPSTPTTAPLTNRARSEARNR